MIDLDALHDNATYKDDKAVCEGIEYVAVNGKIVVSQGETLPIYAGQVLRKGK